MLSVGSRIEFSAILLSSAFSRCARVVWLRNILWDEKSHYLPRALIGPARSLELAERIGLDQRFECHVVGFGPYEKQAKRAPLADRLVFHDPLPNADLPSLLRSVHVCVGLAHKSDQHGGGSVSNALLEQMAAARIVLAWDNAIFRQLLDQRSAYLVPQGDVAALEQALLSILKDPAAARAKGREAQKTTGHYSFEAHVETFVAKAGAE